MAKMGKDHGIEEENKTIFTSLREKVSDCVVREATENDFKAVMNIGNFYDGMDYLPYHYHDFIKDRDYSCIVCESNGRVVGFSCALTHDGGHVIQLRAGRVREAYRGKRYSKEMEIRLLGNAYDDSNIQALWYAKESDFVNTAFFDKKLQTLKVYRFTMPRPNTVSFKTTNMKPLTKTDLEAIFDCPRVCRDLFPNGLINVQSMALGLDKRNIRHIINDNASVYAKLSSNCDQKGEITPECVSSLSVGVRCWCPVGQTCELSFYGKNSEHLDDHIQSQIDGIRDHDAINIGLFVPQFFTQKNLDETFKRFGRNNERMIESFDLVFLELRLQPTPKSKY